MHCVLPQEVDATSPMVRFSVTLRTCGRIIVDSLHRKYKTFNKGGWIEKDFPAIVDTPTAETQVDNGAGVGSMDDADSEPKVAPEKTVSELDAESVDDQTGAVPEAS